MARIENSYVQQNTCYFCQYWPIICYFWTMILVKQKSNTHTSAFIVVVLVELCPHNFDQDLVVAFMFSFSLYCKPNHFEFLLLCRILVFIAFLVNIFYLLVIKNDSNLAQVRTLYTRKISNQRVTMTCTTLLLKYRWSTQPVTGNFSDNRNLTKKKMVKL